MSALQQFRGYLEDVRAEAAKVSWPTRDELRDSTIVVIVTCLLVAAFIGVVDRILDAGVRLIFG